MSQDEPKIVTKGIEDMMILPPAKGLCQVCACDHERDMPHNQQSLYYQMWFRKKHSRWPTWADAVAHTSDRMQAHWKQELGSIGKWSEPPEGIEPVADPYR